MNDLRLDAVLTDRLRPNADSSLTPFRGDGAGFGRSTGRLAVVVWDIAAPQSPLISSIPAWPSNDILIWPASSVLVSGFFRRQL